MLSDYELLEKYNMHWSPGDVSYDKEQNIIQSLRQRELEEQLAGGAAVEAAKKAQEDLRKQTEEAKAATATRTAAETKYTAPIDEALKAAQKRAATGVKTAEASKAETAQLQRQQFAKAQEALQRQGSSISGVQTQLSRMDPSVARLEAQASGQAPSLATAQLKAAQERNLAQQLAAAGSSRGGNQAALQRQLARQQMTTGAETAQQAGILRLQEQQQAQQALQQAYGTQIQGLAGLQQAYGTQIQGQAALQQAATQQQQLVMEDQKFYETLVQNNIAAGMSMEQAQQQAIQTVEQNKIQREGIAAGVATSREQIASQQYMQQQQHQQQILGGLMSGAGSALGAIFSDKRVKKNIKPVSDSELKKALNVQKYADGGVAGGSSSSQIASILGKLFSKKDENSDMEIGEIGTPTKNNTGEISEKPNFGQTLGSSLQAVGSNISGTPQSITEDLNKKKNFGQILGSSLQAVGKSMYQPAKYAEGGVADPNKEEQIRNFLNNLTAYSYEYKNPNMALTRPGKQISVMAQDLEKSPIGKEMVKETEDGTKMVDYAKGFGAILAAQAHLNKRLEELEKKKKRSK